MPVERNRSIIRVCTSFAASIKTALAGRYALI
jgi:hypothetical protein